MHTNIRCAQVQVSQAHQSGGKQIGMLGRKGQRGLVLLDRFVIAVLRNLEISCGIMGQRGTANSCDSAIAGGCVKFRQPDDVDQALAHYLARYQVISAG